MCSVCGFANYFTIGEWWTRKISDFGGRSWSGFLSRWFASAIELQRTNDRIHVPWRFRATQVVNKWTGIIDASSKGRKFIIEFWWWPLNENLPSFFYYRIVDDAEQVKLLFSTANTEVVLSMHSCDVDTNKIVYKSQVAGFRSFKIIIRFTS